jgi:hypothetical protein
MKLSEAISLGSTLNPQAFGKVVDARGGRCVRGAAFEAMGTYGSRSGMELDNPCITMRALDADRCSHQDRYRDQPSAPPKRWPRPPIPIRTTITQYAESELIQLLKWIASDGQLRTDDEIIDEMTATLGFSRRGARIEAALRRAITRWRLAALSERSSSNRHR